MGHGKHTSRRHIPGTTLKLLSMRESREASPKALAGTAVTSRARSERRVAPASAGSARAGRGPWWLEPPECWVLGGPDAEEVAPAAASPPAPAAAPAATASEAAGSETSCSAAPESLCAAPPKTAATAALHQTRNWSPLPLVRSRRVGKSDTKVPAATNPHIFCPHLHYFVNWMLQILSSSTLYNSLPLEGS